jgi:hypothetical protein
MNAIIASATGYTEADLQVFLSSIERSCKKSKVFLILYKQDREYIKNLQDKYEFLKFVFVRKKIKRAIRLYRQIARYLSTKDYSSIDPLLVVIGRYPLHISIDRYFIALQLINAYGDSFSNVLLTDSRDVVIQRDPFSLIDRKLVSGLEEKNIGSCPINSIWIKELYGEGILNKMSDRRIVCSGVTLGPTREVKNYLSKMCSEIWKCLPQITVCGGFDQGIHNHLVFEEKIPFDLTDNRRGLIATLGYENPINILKEPASRLVKMHDEYPAIVHQYDRHSDLVIFFKESFSLK